jgi:hypothetical protein
MTPRPRFLNDPFLFAEYQLAELLHLTVQEVRVRLTTRDVVGWKAYWATKAALQDQAIAVARAKMESGG